MKTPRWVRLARTLVVVMGVAVYALTRSNRSPGLVFLIGLLAGCLAICVAYLVTAKGRWWAK